jgi:hypothetical protein
MDGMTVWAGAVLMLLGASIISYFSWVKLRVNERHQISGGYSPTELKDAERTLRRTKVTWVLLRWGVLAILLMFLFERQTNDVLRLAGYNDEFVSYFPFVRNNYFTFISSKKTASISVAHFHILDVVVWLSIIVWGAWLADGIFRLRQCDNGFRLAVARVLERYRGRRLILYITWLFMLLGPIIVSIQPKPLADNPEMRLILTYIPQIYFLVVALTYYICGGFLLGFSILLLIWKIASNFSSERHSA